MFADDTKLFYTNKNIKVLFETASKELHCANEWLKLGKTKYLFFHKQSARDSIPLRLPTTTFNSIELKRESFIKFLGVITGPPHTLSHCRGTNFSERGNFKVV